jgi:hypothetical protein
MSIDPTRAAKRRMMIAVAVSLVFNTATMAISAMAFAHGTSGHFGGGGVGHFGGGRGHFRGDHFGGGFSDGFGSLYGFGGDGPYNDYSYSGCYVLTPSGYEWVCY